MNKLNKDLQYYLNLPYKIEVEPIREEDGGGFFARLPQFGAMGITGDGETIEEALDMLNELKTAHFQRYLDEGRKIPEPKKDEGIKSFSGRILLRIPRELHRQMALKAVQNGISQNQYINYLLTKQAANDRGVDLTR